MVDFTTPNLCGASEAFNKVVSQFDSIKETLKNQLEGEIDTLKSELTSALNVIETDIRGLISELPDVPDISLISEIQNFLALPAGSQASLNALTSLRSQFGEGLAALGQDLDSIISTASSAFSGGIDLCGGTIPNFVIGPDGLKEKPQDSGMPDKDPAPELVSALLTNAVNIGESMRELAVNSSNGVVEVTTNLLPTDMDSQSGNVSITVIQKYNEKDAVIISNLQKKNIAASPAIAKVLNASASAVNLPPVNSLKNPDEIQKTLKEYQRRLSVASNNFKQATGLLESMSRKLINTFPLNILSGGAEILVNNQRKSFDLRVTGLPTIPNWGENDSTYTSNQMNYVGNDNRVLKQTNSLWRQFYSFAKQADKEIKDAFEANRPEIEGNAQEMKKRLDKILQKIIDLEKGSERGVKILGETTEQTEKTYAVPAPSTLITT